MAEWIKLPLSITNLILLKLTNWSLNEEVDLWIWNTKLNKDVTEVLAILEGIQHVVEQASIQSPKNLQWTLKMSKSLLKAMMWWSLPQHATMDAPCK